MMGLDGWQVPVSAGGGLLLDSISTSAARAYSMRKLRSTYAGSAIRIRRTSDNAEQDIGFDGSNNLDTSAISSFVGVNSAFIRTWYDQSTNGDNLIQTSTASTPALQPRIVNAGTIDTVNSLPAAFSAISQLTLMAGASSLSLGEASILIAYNFAAPFLTFMGAATGTGSGSEIIFVGNSGSSSFITSGIFGSSIFVNGGGNTVVFSGALQQADGNTGSPGTLTAPQLFAERNNVGRYLNGWLGEAVFFATALSSGDRTIMRTNQKTYWGTP